MMGGAGEAARLFITVGMNAAGAVAGMKALGTQVDDMGGKVQTWGKTVGAAFQGPLDAFGRIGDAADGMRSVAGAVAGLAQTLFSGAARNEQYAMSFEVLMGSTDRATSHIEELKRFAAETPFTMPGIVDASKQLEVMGGSALNTIENLRTVGDVAAGTGTDIAAVGVQFGRLYDGMKNGTPFGEVMMRLGEMGALSGESKRKILELAEQVESGGMTMEDAWKGATKEFGRFAGITAKQSKSLGGLWSTFTDTLDDGFARIGTKLLPIVKPVLEGAIALFGKLADAALVVMDNFEIFAPFVVAILVPAVWALTAAVWGLASGVIAATWPFLALAGILTVTFLAVKTLIEAGLNLMGWLLETIPALQAVIMPFTALAEVIGFVGGVIGDFVGTTAEASAQAVANTGYMATAIRDDMYDRAPEIDAAAKAMAAPIEARVYMSASAAQAHVRSMARTILSDLDAAREVMSGSASAYADAMYDPIIAAADLYLVRQQQKDKDLLADLQSSNKATVAEARKKVAELEKQEIALTTLLMTYGTDQQQIAAIQGYLTSRDWAKAYAKGTPEQNAALREYEANLRARLVELQATGKKGGEAAGYDTGMGVKSGIGQSTTGAYNWGMRTMGAYANGIRDSAATVTQAARTAVYGANGVLRANSPPGPESPLHDIDRWGFRTGETYVQELARGLSGAGAAVAAALRPAGAPLAAAPSPAAMGAPRGAGGGGAMTLQFNFQSVTPYSPGEQVELGNRVGPAVYEYLRSRGAAG